MNLEEEHQTMHSRGEMVKFMLLVVMLVGTVLLIALLRPLIFERVLPAVMGWDGEPETIVVPPTETPQQAPSEPPQTATAEPTLAPEATEAGEQPEAPGAAATPQRYEVQGGDTLVAIAERFGVSLQALIEANAIANPNRIQPGDVLTIPTP